MFKKILKYFPNKHKLNIYFNKILKYFPNKHKLNIYFNKNITVIKNYLVKYNKIKTDIYKNRKIYLFISALLGLSLVIIFNPKHIDFIPDRAQGTVFVLILSLPTAFLLWLFRTYDVKSAYDLSNIQKTTDLCLSENLRSRVVGVIQIAKIRENASQNEKDIIDNITRGIELSPKASNNASQNEKDIIDNITRDRDIDLSPKASNKEIADFRGANLTGLDLSNAELTGADLTGANLTGANLTGVNLTRANLTGAELIEASLTRASLTGARLTEARLTGANLAWAELIEASLTGADLTGAHLTGANLTGVNLTRANLTRANLTRANLTGAELTDAKFNSSKFDKNTKININSLDKAIISSCLWFDIYNKAEKIGKDELIKRLKEAGINRELFLSL